MIPIGEIADERGIDEEDVYEILELFLEYTQTEDLVALKAAVEQGNHALAREKAHSIKGAALNLKLEEIASLARNVEKKCDTSDVEGVQDLLDAITEQLQKVNDLLGQQR